MSYDELRCVIVTLWRGYFLEGSYAIISAWRGSSDAVMRGNERCTCRATRVLALGAYKCLPNLL
jgi:hypothetical protein